MCARRPTSAMPKSFLCCERTFCRSMVVMFCALKWSVLMSWCLLRGQVMWWSRHLMRCNGLCCVMSRDAIRCHGDELYYSSTTLYYKVLLQYDSVLQILLCTTPVLQSTTQVLLQYYLVLQSTTPVLTCTTKYYSSTTMYYSNTTLYYKVLLQYYSAVQSTTPILLCTTKYDSNTIPYYKYYSVLLQYYPVLQSTTQVLLCTTPVLPCTTKYYSSTTKYFMIDPHHIWNVIYNARSNKRQPPTSANTAPATQNESHDWSASHMKRHLQCAEQQESPSHFTKYCACHAKWISCLIRITYETSFPMRGATGINLQPHQILRLPRKMNLMIDPRHIWNVIYNARSNSQHPPTAPNTAPATQNDRPKSDRNLLKTAETQFPMRRRSENDPTMIREWSDHEPVTPQPAAQQRLLFTLARSRFYWKLQRFPLHLMIGPHHIWNVIYNAWSNRHHPPTAPNTAPATQNECHDWSCSPMKRHFQCAEQQESPSHFTKYCACHAKWISCLIRITYETSFPMRGATGINLQPHQILRLPRKIALPNLREINWKQLKWHFQCATDPTMIRPRSDHDPRMIRPRKRKPQPAAPQRLLFALARSRFYWKLQRFPLRLSFQISPHAAPATKSDTWASPNAAPATKNDTWTSPNAAPATKNDTWASPNAAPATKSDTWASPNAAPATKSDTWTSPMLHLPHKVKHERHQMLHLPQKVTHELLLLLLLLLLRLLQLLLLLKLLLLLLLLLGDY